MSEPTIPPSRDNPSTSEFPFTWRSEAIRLLYDCAIAAEAIDSIPKLRPGVQQFVCQAARELIRRTEAALERYEAEIDEDSGA